mgnify:CR=1 FL=1
MDRSVDWVGLSSCAMLALVIISSAIGCTRLTPQEREHYASRTYDIPFEHVFEAVKERVRQYPMGLQEADLQKGVVISRIGGTTPGIGATVGYQITVAVTMEGHRTRVAPSWQMNISSEPTKTHLLPVTIDDRPLLYWEFFDALDEQLQKAQP